MRNPFPLLLRESRRRELYDLAGCHYFRRGSLSRAEWCFLRADVCEMRARVIRDAMEGLIEREAA